MRTEVRKLYIVSHNPNIDSGELVVKNQSQPFKYPNLKINIDIRPRSYEPYVEVVMKKRFLTHGIPKRFWVYQFEPSEEFAHIVMEPEPIDGSDDYVWNIRCEQVRRVNKIGAIVHTHRLAELDDLLLSLGKKTIFKFKKFNNTYLKGSLHETVVEERAYFFVLGMEEEAEFLTKLKIQNLHFDLITT